MSDDVLCALLMVITFFMGAWNGWMWREIHARRIARTDGAVATSSGPTSSKLVGDDGPARTS